ncbi:MAG: dUTP diphosphatase [Muribaculaceae bacterium]|nr:dUTP diphosphatase [Muribaculaceae bacterium]
MERIDIKVINTSDLELPQYASSQAAGMDIRAAVDTPIVIAAGARALIPTGLSVELPEGFEIQLRPRSGLALRSGITLLNSPGTIDADYRGEIGVILINHSDQPFTIERGDRICQMVVAPCMQAVWHPCDTLAESDRAEGGFGHSGIK